jgi:hypothetical protein
MFGRWGSTTAIKEERAMKRLFIVALLGLLVGLLGCTSQQSVHADDSAITLVSTQSSSSFEALAFTDADLEGLEKGLAAEAALVTAARERASNAKTPEERAEAAQGEWEEETIPDGALASGLPLERYISVRQTVNHVLETLNFQGKVNGPLKLDLEHASPEMKQRLRSDPFAELNPASAVALRAKMSGVVPVWVAYMRLVALNG